MKINDEDVRYNDNVTGREFGRLSEMETEHGLAKILSDDAISAEYFGIITQNKVDKWPDLPYSLLKGIIKGFFDDTRRA